MTCFICATCGTQFAERATPPDSPAGLVPVQRAQLAAGASRRRVVRQQLHGLALDDLYGFTWGRNILGGTRSAVDASFDRYFRAIGRAELAGSPA